MRAEPGDGALGGKSGQLREKGEMHSFCPARKPAVTQGPHHHPTLGAS
jgi:hypothetical protein